MARIDRTPYEFDKSTIIECLKKADFRCELCDRSKEDLKADNEAFYFEIHHILGIAIAVRYFPEIPIAIIKSLENAMCLCVDCHKYIERTDQNHFTIASKLVERCRVNV